MKLDLIQTKTGKYKIISKSNHKNPALEHLADLLKEANKYSDVKIGIYNIFGGEFQTHKTVYSYISDRFEKMGRSKFYQFIKGKAQLKGKNSIFNTWKPLDPNKEMIINIEELLEDVK